jgi:hypothetical protein
LKHIKKLIHSLVILSTLILALSACSGERADTTPLPDSESKAVAVGTSSAPVTTSGNEELSHATGTAPTATTVILTVNDQPVYWPEFHFWVNFIGKYYKAAVGVDEITDWDKDQNGMPLRDFFLTTAVGYACKDRAIEAKARELEIGLTEDDLSEIEKQRTDNIKIYGSVSEYRRIVSSMYMSEDVFNYVTRLDYLGRYLFKHFYGANGEKFSDEDVSEYIRENGFICAKYIFLSGLDADGNPLDAGKQSENETLLKDLLGRIDASDAPLTLFTELMNEYGQDRTLAQYPHGRLFITGGKGEAFETACRKLKVNEYSDVVSADDGSYIILRTPIFPAMTADSSGNTLRYLAAYETFKSQVENWSTQMSVEYHPAYYEMDVEGLL